MQSVLFRSYCAIGRAGNTREEVRQRNRNDETSRTRAAKREAEEILRSWPRGHEFDLYLSTHRVWRHLQKRVALAGSRGSRREFHRAIECMNNLYENPITCEGTAYFTINSRRIYKWMVAAKMCFQISSAHCDHTHIYHNYILTRSSAVHLKHCWPNTSKSCLPAT